MRVMPCSRSALLTPATSGRRDNAPGQVVTIPNENQDFVEEKFKELDSDQIEGAEFEILGLEIRFERNKRFDFRSRILISDSRPEF